MSVRGSVGSQGAGRRVRSIRRSVGRGDVGDLGGTGEVLRFVQFLKGHSRTLSAPVEPEAGIPSPDDFFVGLSRNGLSAVQERLADDRDEERCSVKRDLVEFASDCRRTLPNPVGDVGFELTWGTLRGRDTSLWRTQKRLRQKRPFLPHRMLSFVNRDECHMVRRAGVDRIQEPACLDRDVQMFPSRNWSRMHCTQTRSRMRRSEGRVSNCPFKSESLFGCRTSVESISRSGSAPPWSATCWTAVAAPRSRSACLMPRSVHQRLNGSWSRRACRHAYDCADSSIAGSRG